MTKVKTGQKIGLVLLGVFLAAILLEGVLRLGGGVFYFLQQRQNAADLQPGKTITVLCIGESTTAFGGSTSYPLQLQEILNERQGARAFSVINKGMPAATTTQVISSLPLWLDQFQPQIVVAMLGINDNKDVVSAQNPTTDKQGFFRDLRVVKLVRMIHLHLEARKQKIPPSSLPEKIVVVEQKIEKEPKLSGYYELMEAYETLEKKEDEKRVLHEALRRWPKDTGLQVRAGLFYFDNEEFQKAQQYAQRAVSLLAGTPKVLPAYNMLAQCFAKTGQFAQAEKIFQEFLEMFPDDPNHFSTYGELAMIYLEQGRYRDAVAMFVRQVRIAPQKIGVYADIAHGFREKGLHKELELILSDALRQIPEGSTHHMNVAVELAYCLMENGKNEQAERLFQKIKTMDLDSRKDGNIDLTAGIAEARRGQGRGVNSNEILEEGRYLPVTVLNLRRVQEIVAKKGIRIVWAQYPQRGLAPLRQALSPFQQVVFVDNEKTFEGAVRKEGYDQIFTDRFAGDFGHCTAKGNRLLAGNVARVIREMLDQRGEKTKQ